MSLVIELNIKPSLFGVEQYRVKEFSDDDGQLAFWVSRICDSPPFLRKDQEIEGAEWVIEGEAAQSFLAKVHDLSVKVCPDFAMGLDGTTVTLMIECGFNRVEFRWWEEVPEQWGGFRGLLAELYTGQPGVLKNDISSESKNG